MKVKLGEIEERSEDIEFTATVNFHHMRGTILFQARLKFYRELVGIRVRNDPLGLVVSQFRSFPKSYYTRVEE